MLSGGSAGGCKVAVGGQAVHSMLQKIPPAALNNPSDVIWVGTSPQNLLAPKLNVMLPIELSAVLPAQVIMEEHATLTCPDAAAALLVHPILQRLWHVTAGGACRWYCSAPTRPLLPLCVCSWGISPNIWPLLFRCPSPALASFLCVLMGRSPNIQLTQRQKQHTGGCCCHP